MGDRVFGIDIAGIVAKNIGPGVHDAVVYAFDPAAPRAPGAKLTQGRQRIAVPHKGKGFWEDYSPGQIGEQVLATDRKAVLIGDTFQTDLSKVKKGDRVEIKGVSMMVWRLESRDPAGAVYKIQCRDQAGPDGI